LRGIQEVLRNHKLVVYDPHSKMFWRWLISWNTSASEFLKCCDKHTSIMRCNPGNMGACSSIAVKALRYILEGWFETRWGEFFQLA
jgi:hypothetical protein